MQPSTDVGKSSHLKIKRVYVDILLHDSVEIPIDGNVYHYLFKVLRHKINDEIVLFNGDGYNYLSAIKEINKKSAIITVLQSSKNNSESNLKTVLIQGLAKGDKMDFVMQKAVELGVNEIIPVQTAFSNVKLDEKRIEKKIQHWQSIIISACEQSERSIIPTLHPIQTIENSLKIIDSKEIDMKLFLHPYIKNNTVIDNGIQSVAILIGPEGGLSDIDIAIAQQHGFSGLQFGQRILRTETAAIAALTYSQIKWGDIGGLV